MPGALMLNIYKNSLLNIYKKSLINRYIVVVCFLAIFLSQELDVEVCL